MPPEETSAPQVQPEEVSEPEQKIIRKAEHSSDSATREESVPQSSPESAQPEETSASTATPTAASKNTEQAERQSNIAVNKKKKTSGFSLKSIKEKNAHNEQRLAKQKNKVELTDEYSEEQIQEAWQEYTKKLRKKGLKILASIMETDTPQVKAEELVISLPNDTMRRELRSVEKDLLQFIKQEVNNTGIRLTINVNETVSKKYAFTPHEKYEKLKEKNPLIEKLRTNFDLDI